MYFICSTKIMYDAKTKILKHIIITYKHIYNLLNYKYHILYYRYGFNHISGVGRSANQEND